MLEIVPGIGHHRGMSLAQQDEARTSTWRPFTVVLVVAVVPVLVALVLSAIIAWSDWQQAVPANSPNPSQATGTGLNTFTLAGISILLFVCLVGSANAAAGSLALAMAATWNERRAAWRTWLLLGSSLGGLYIWMFGASRALIPGDITRSASAEVVVIFGRIVVALLLILLAGYSARRLRRHAIVR